MFGNIKDAIARIKSDVAQALEASLISRLCVELGHRWRNRELDPATTVQSFLLQVLHHNTACSHVPHLLGKNVSAEAYIQARARLSLELFQRLLAEVCRSVQACLEASTLWRGHRLWLVDGSSCSMPDTPELQQAFGQPGVQAPGCGFPVAHLLTLFHAGTGLLLRTIVAPLRTHDQSQASQLHAELASGDVLIADRGFCSYAHLALLVNAGWHAVMRLVMLDAARRQEVPVEQISFLDALRVLQHARAGCSLRKLEVLRLRPGRHEPRVRKRRPKEYDLMRRPRDELRKVLFTKRVRA